MNRRVGWVVLGLVGLVWVWVGVGGLRWTGVPGCGNSAAGCWSSKLRQPDWSDKAGQAEERRGCKVVVAVCGWFGPPAPEPKGSKLVVC